MGSELSKGINAPIIRFAGFTDAWEQRKLENVAKITMGQSPDGANYTSNPNDHILVQGNADMKDHRVCPRVWTTQVTKTADPGDIILSVRAPVGEVGKTDYNVVLGRGVSGIKGNEFVYQNLIRMNSNGYWDKLSTGSTFDSINSGDISGAVLILPKEAEQERIGKFFSAVDISIVLHQRKLDELKTLKKGLLQKMFPNDGEDRPLVRFSGFTDAWEQRELNKVSSKVNEKNVGMFFRSPLTNSAEFGIVDQSDYFDHDVANKNNLYGYYIIRNDDFVYNPRISVTAPVGPVSRNKLGKSGVISPLYTAFRIHDIDPTYLEEFFKTSYWHLFMKTNGNTGARSDRFAIKDEVFFKLPVPCPEIREQKLVGGFLNTLDSSIVLHQRKLDELKTLKKGLLQKMFI